jgi:hypothetical protein
MGKGYLDNLAVSQEIVKEERSSVYHGDNRSQNIQGVHRLIQEEGCVAT